jgi:hypothetical protein
MNTRKVLVIWTILLIFAAFWVTPAFADCASDSSDCTDGYTDDSGEIVDEGDYSDGDWGVDDGYIDEGEYDDGGDEDGYIDEGEYTDGGDGEDGYIDEGEYTDDGDYEYYEVIDPYVGDGEVDGIFYIIGTTDDSDGVNTDLAVEMYGAATNTTATTGSQHHAASASAAHPGASLAHMRLNANDLAAPVALFCGVNSTLEVWDIDANGEGTLAFTLPIDQLLGGEIGLGLGNQLSILDGGQAELLSLDSPGAYAFSFDPLVCAGA